MATDAEILAEVRRAFANCPRPERFTNDTCNCDECLDHERVLSSHNVDTIGLAELGNPGWDPICFACPAGFLYFFPALARLALAPPDPSQDWYGAQLVFHMGYDHPFDPEQRQAVMRLLHHLLETRLDALADAYCIDRLGHAHRSIATALCYFFLKIETY